MQLSRVTVWALPCVALLAGLCASPASSLTVPGADGSDGALNITSSTTIDLALAPTGVWNGANAAPGKGVYDPDKWAVVFRYNSVTLNSAVLTFSNHPSKAPVVWLVNGNVTITSSARIEVNGNSPSGTSGGDGGPGGGPGSSTTPDGPGFGLGGAQTGVSTPGIFSDSITGNPFKPYGSPTLIPLVGGSGGHRDGGTGGGGGGAILIAATGTLRIDGRIVSDGEWYGGSGGGIRLCAASILGAGGLSAIGSDGASNGRIRIEAGTFTGALLSNPVPTTAVVPDPVVLWPPADAATVRIVSVNAVPIPTTAGAYWPPAPPDMSLLAAAAYDVIVETKNVPVTRKVRVKMTPRAGTATLTDATLVSGNLTLATWKATVQFGQGFCTVQARVDTQ